MQRGRVPQQQHAPALPRLASEGADEAGDTDEAQGLPAARRQREVGLSDPAEGDPGAVGGDAGQGVRPQTQVHSRGASSRVRVVRRPRRDCRRFLLRLLPAFDSALEVIFVSGFQGAVRVGTRLQQLQVLCRRHTHHGVQLWLAFGQQGKADPYQAGGVRGQERRYSRRGEGRPFTGATCPLTSGCGGLTPT